MQVKDVSHQVEISDTRKESKVYVNFEKTSENLFSNFDMVKRCVAIMYIISSNLQPLALKTVKQFPYIIRRKTIREKRT